MKRILCFALTALLVCTAIMTAVFAQTPGAKVLMLGDSITTGYGLSDPSTSYAALLKDALAISDDDFTNAAVDGATSADLLELIPTLENKIKEADVIAMTVGGNDLLNVVWDAASKVSGKEVTGAAQLMEIKNDPELYAALQNELLGVGLMNIVNAANAFNDNIGRITHRLRALNADAQILVITQYNPFSGVEEYGQVDTACEGFFNMLNGYMKAACEANACTLVDIVPTFNKKAMALTNIGELDIHPNAAGHAEIFALVKAALADFEAAWTTKPVETDPPATKPVETDPPATKPVETDPPATKPVETDPPATKPVETDPPATKPVETDPPATKPVETDPPASSPAESDPEVSTGAATDPESEKPGETTGKDDSTADGNASTAKPSTPADTDAPEKKGCGGLIASAIIPMLLIVPAVWAKKKQ